MVMFQNGKLITYPLTSILGNAVLTTLQAVKDIMRTPLVPSADGIVRHFCIG